jgi:hypothetical protein
MIATGLNQNTYIESNGLTEHGDQGKDCGITQHHSSKIETKILVKVLVLYSTAYF